MRLSVQEKAAAVARRLADADLEQYQEAKNIDKTQSFFDDYSVYSYADSSFQNSAALRRNKSVGASRFAQSTNLDSGFKFIKASGPNKIGEAGEGVKDPIGGKRQMAESIPVHGSSTTFDKLRSVENSATIEAQESSSQQFLDVINEVNEKEFDSNANAQIGIPTMPPQQTAPIAAEPNFL